MHCHQAGRPLARVSVVQVLSVIAISICPVWLQRGNGQQLDDQIELRILTYNIHHGEGVDRQLNLERIAEVIRSVDPDLVALQEVDKNFMRPGSRRIDQPAELSRLTGMEVAFGANLKVFRGGYGNAILSKLPILAYRNHPLPKLDRSEKRGVLSAEIRFGRGTLTFLATHFDHRSDDGERLESAGWINRFVTDSSSVRAILAGDINAQRNSKVLNRLNEAWEIAGQTNQPTFPAGAPNRQIDFVFFSSIEGMESCRNSRPGRTCRLGSSPLAGSLSTNRTRSGSYRRSQRKRAECDRPGPRADHCRSP